MIQEKLLLRSGMYAMQQWFKEIRKEIIQCFKLFILNKEFGQKGRDAAFNEMRQLHERSVFVPVNISALSYMERNQAMESLIFPVKK